MRRPAVSKWSLLASTIAERTDSAMERGSQASAEYEGTVMAVIPCIRRTGNLGSPAFEVGGILWAGPQDHTHSRRLH